MLAARRAPSRRTFINLFAGLVALAGLTVSPLGDARSPVWRPPPKPAFSVQLQSADGRALPSFGHRGQTFVLGEHGDRYVVVVRNPTAQRVEAVVTVDGRDAISGQRGSLRQRGYIVPAFGSVRVEGFRQNLDQVAAFRFTSPGQSYSAQMGTPQNVGVIGVALFAERAEPEIARDERRWRRAPSARPSAPAPNSAAPRKSTGRASDSSDASGIGTGWGETRQSQVRQVSFVRARSTPSSVLTLRYDDAVGLEARGIDLGRHHWRRADATPVPFPDSRFARPPGR